tara:strand:- start:145 stop:480 length:336 start_codon:yes stop_codon:yes gene_type:complete
MTKTNTPMTNEMNAKIPSWIYTKHQEVGAYKPKAKIFTYNYSCIDAVVVECYKDTTTKDIASALREPINRVKYRIDVMRDNDLVSRKQKFATRTVNAKAITEPTSSTKKVA